MLHISICRLAPSGPERWHCGYGVSWAESRYTTVVVTAIVGPLSRIPHLRGHSVLSTWRGMGDREAGGPVVYHCGHYLAIYE